MENIATKIGQLDTLQDVDCDGVVLCDTDLAFAERLDRFLTGDHIAAKPVDYSNPPLALLEEMRTAAGIEAAPALARTSCEGEPTYASNCNGGVYIMPRRYISALRPAWRSCAELALSMAGAWAMHADQIGFSLATLKLGIPIAELPVEYNFPMHVPDAFARMQFSAPRVLHYHNCQDGLGRLTKTGHRIVDGVVDAINASLADSAGV
jgi:hypothetical protein